MNFHRCELLESLGIVHFHHLVHAHGQILSGGVEAEAAQTGSFKSVHCFNLVSQVPNLDFVIRAGSEVVSVFRKCQAVDGVFVGLDVLQQGVIAEIPELHSAVLTCQSHHVTIGVEFHSIERSRALFQRRESEGFSLREVVETKGLVQRGQNGEVAVGVDVTAGHSLFVSVQLEGDLAFGGGIVKEVGLVVFRTDQHGFLVDELDVRDFFLLSGERAHDFFLVFIIN